MRSRTSTSLVALATLLATLTSLVTAHTVITYPGGRGDNLRSNSTVYETNGLGEGPNNTFPYGMQWMYPCGGMPTTTNRTKWPIGGGAISVQPGWQSGHLTAYFYINMGFGTVPANMSNPMLPVFQINGPSKDPYPGTFCLPQVPLPANTTVQVGDNATIQVIETAVHGASLYNCADITFADPKDVPEVTPANCYNDSHISFQLVFATSSLSGASPAGSSLGSLSYLAFVPLLLVGVLSLAA